MVGQQEEQFTSVNEEKTGSHLNGSSRARGLTAGPAQGEAAEVTIGAGTNIEELRMLNMQVENTESDPGIYRTSVHCCSQFRAQPPWIPCSELLKGLERRHQNVHPDGVPRAQRLSRGQQLPSGSQPSAEGLLRHRCHCTFFKGCFRYWNLPANINEYYGNGWNYNIVNRGNCLPKALSKC